MAGGSVVVVTVTGGGCTTMVRARVAFRVPLVARTVKLLVPAAVGEPAITPAADSVSPPGSAPLARLQVKLPVPPVAASGWLYATPTVPSGRVVVPMATGGSCTTMVSARVPL